MEPAGSDLQKEKFIVKQGWITDEILQLMDKRRPLKGKCNEEYRGLQ